MLCITLGLWMFTNLCYSFEMKSTRESYNPVNSTNSGQLNESNEYEVFSHSFAENGTDLAKNFTDSSFATKEVLNNTKWATLIKNIPTSNTGTSFTSSLSNHEVLNNTETGSLVNIFSSSNTETSLTSYHTTHDTHLTSSPLMSSTSKDHEATSSNPILTQKSKGIYPMAVAGLALMAGLLTTFVVVLIFILWYRKSNNLVYEIVPTDVEQHM